jgi:hypothetical protein
MKARFLFFLLILTATHSKAQDVMNTFQNNYIQPPPDVSSLGKFIDFPIGYYTGIPKISIPVFHLKDGAIDIPISLDYHSGGIKVSELASSVGLGWSLMAGGMVMRTVRGAPDEGTNKTCGQAGCYASPRGYYLDKGFSKMEPLNYPNSNVLWSPINMDIQGAMAGYYDYEPDLYFFNFNGHTGKFVFDENQNPVLLTDDNIRIQTTLVNGTFVWAFTLADGTEYIFGENRMFDQNEPIPVTSTGNLPEDPDAMAPSCWYLTRIIYPNTKDTAYFNYTTETYNYYDIAPEQQVFSTQLVSGYSDLLYACGNTYTGTTLLFTNVFGRRLTSITTKNFTINFVSKTARADLIPYTEEPLPYMLDSIEIFNGSQCLKRFGLAHSYFFSSSATGIDNNTLLQSMRDDVTDTKRLKLVSVTEVSPDGSLIKNPYSFIYQESVPLPRRMSFDQDHWGYSNNSAGNANFNFYPAVYHPACSVPVLGGQNRTPKWPEMSGFLLTGITDQLGGTTIFSFEPDSGSYNGGPVQIGGGIRIHQVAVTDNATAVTKYMTYYYGPGGGSGVLYHQPRYLWDLTNEYWHDVGVTFRGYIANPATKYLFKASQSVVPLQDFDGNNIGYSSVTEIFGARGEGGYKVYTFQTTDPALHNSRLDQSNYAAYTTSPPANSSNIDGIYPTGNFNNIAPQNLVYYAGSDVDNYFPAAPDQLSFSKGNLLGTDTYDSAGNLLNRLRNTYTITYHENYLIRGMKINRQSVVGSNGEIEANTYDDSYTFYKLHAGISHLTQAANTEYRNGQPMVTTHQYGYESAYHTLKTSDLTTTSMGDQLLAKTYYTWDYAPGATTDNIFAKARNRNMLMPVAQEVWKNSQLIKDTIIAYRDFASNITDTFINPGTVYAADIQSPLTTTQANESTALTGQLSTLLPNSYFNPKAYFLFGGTTSRIIEQRLANREAHSIIWDNQYFYPIADVTNADYTDVAYCSFESYEQGNWHLSDTTLDRNTGLTGLQSYDLTSAKTITATASGHSGYIVSYWSKGGGQTVQANGAGVSATISGPTKNGWTYYEHHLPAGTTSVQVTGSSTIDELRLYPLNAQMSTATYLPLIGMTSECDINNKVTTFEYDGLLRLRDIKDQDGNVIKTMDYHYHGQ